MCDENDLDRKGADAWKDIYDSRVRERRQEQEDAKRRQQEEKEAERNRQRRYDELTREFARIRCHIKGCQIHGAPPTRVQLTSTRIEHYGGEWGSDTIVGEDTYAHGTPGRQILSD